MDFTKLKAAALRDGDDEEAVTVNTRALIDKVLARYSGEWTTLRELIQNAADAQATKVAIKFDTLPSAQIPLSNTTNQSEMLKHVLLNHTLRRLVVTNDGQAFGVNDWSRLKRIAEGNPDETKIGAFGVGFYSVFADCEEPFVSSGNEAMAFYWKANSLFTKKLQLPLEQGNPNTSFVLEYRNSTTPMPNLISITQFLATSLTFVALQNIELWVDDWRIMSLQKKTAPSVQVPLARDVETRTKEGLMRVTSLERESVQMDATFMNVVGWKPSITNQISKPGYDNSYGTSGEAPSIRSFFSRLTASTSHTQLKTKQMREEKALQDVVLEDLTALTTTNVFLRVTTAGVRTSISSQFASELERATKKPPPKITKLAILTSSYDEEAASSGGNPVAKGVDVFSSVLPGKKPGGRIFIGFPTHQTTGAGMHLSAPSVIPTVERESIDLNARWVVTWNREMLRVAGIMARLAFSNEMADLSAKVKRATEVNGHGSKVTKQEIAKFMPEAIHTLKTFTFGDSTPASQVSQLIEEAFWTAYKKPSIEVYSTRGVLPTTTVRLATEDLSGFVEGIPVVPGDLAKADFVTKLREYGLITEITVGDVKQELSAKALTKDQLLQFISWAGRKASTGDIDGPTIHSLLDAAVAMTGDADCQGDVIALGSIKHYISINKIPAEIPVPPSTIPFIFTKGSAVHELQALGWEPLEIVPWLRFLVETNQNRPPEQSLTTSVLFAARTLQILSKGWDLLSQSSKETVVQLLKPITIVPTKSGMKKPGEAFFANVRLFDDLPTVISCPGVKEKFFAAIGVRKTVDLETIFSRLLAPNAEIKDGKPVSGARHMELIKYLTSVRDDIPADDVKRLKASPMCPAEAGPPGRESTQATAKLYKVSELFEPKDSLRTLGLPILQWPGPPDSYRAGSIEGRFLASLGIRSYPTVPELIEMMASPDNEKRNRAMNYFMANHQLNNYGSFQVGTTEKQFLPLQGDDKRLVSPAECFTNERCAVLGFNIMRKDLHAHAIKFGVAMNPPLTECVNKLISNPPQNKRDASTLFGYFASRVGEIGQNSVAKLSDARIVPVAPRPQVTNGYINEKAVEHSTVQLLSPRHCYLGSSSTYGEIFDFVDFGTEANAFLLRCGSKNEPTILEIASLACREPARLLTIVQTPEKYMDILRKMADDLPTLKKDKLLFKQMKASKFLIGSIEIPANKENRKSMSSQLRGHVNDGFGLDEEDLEDAAIKTWQLAVPANIVVVDDYSSYRLFKANLICAPEYEKLEEFYSALGSPTLGSLVQEDTRTGPAVANQNTSTKLFNHMLERSRLFLHEYDRRSIKHDSRWLEKNIRVQIVSSISLRRSLRGNNLSHTEKRTAACTHERHNGYTLFITAGSIDMYQVSVVLCKLLLDRPNQQAYLTFESFMKLGLYELRSRGYNVERILRAKKAEQQIAEEERKKQLAAEQQQIKEQEEQWKAENQVMPSPRDGRRKSELPMPGGFGSDSPENSPAPIEKNKPRGLFSGLTRRLGLDSSSSSSGGEVQQQLQNFLGGHVPPKDTSPAYADIDKGTSDRTKGTEKVTSPAAVQQNLMNAIQSSRAHDSSTLFSPPTTQTVKEQASYCDTTPSTNISYQAEASNGMRIFVSKTLSLAQNDFLSGNGPALNTFANMLFELADIYNLSRKALHIYYDESGATIAFNSNGSIFCNFRFFAQLHSKKLQNIDPKELGEGKVEAAAYWWIVMAHELAHNLVKDHSSDHSFYTEMLIANYFPKMMVKAALYMQNAARSGRSLDAPPSGSSSQPERSLLD
ncbi:hypothetical protein BJ875DRAFT_365787 [Amylocarpus encephaloides]|uniref:Sacsin/Nov domain-containing protein n=1 Tax=Amylocarpus encephaloides TaxID=45428 RepID=A0A9P7YTG2_9HELO|nr:hypothetical protein BJ875DRAFT_365787 [Amylocarpus encephaloides]